MFSLICAWINGWVNNRESGDLRRYRAHYDVIIMWLRIYALPGLSKFVESYRNCNFILVSFRYSGKLALLYILDIFEFNCCYIYISQNISSEATRITKYEIGFSQLLDISSTAMKCYAIWWRMENQNAIHVLDWCMYGHPMTPHLILFLLIL